MSKPDRPGDIFDALDSGLIVLDESGRVIGWNSWMVGASGIGMDNAKGKALDELFEALAPRIATAVSQALDLGASSLITHSLHPSLFALKTPAGGKLIHNISVRPLGHPPAHSCLVQVVDVTAMAGRERLLRERQNARYDALVGSAPDAIVTLDVDGIIQLANPAAEREFGCSASELIGRPLAPLLGDSGPWLNAFKHVVEGINLTRPIEVIANRRNGAPSYLEASASMWQTEGRTFVTAILRDVNERRVAVDALRRLNQTLETRVARSTADRNRMWALSTDIMVVTDADGGISAVNPAWTSLLGWTESELIDNSLFDFVAEEDRERLAGEMKALFSGTPPALIELRMLSKTGTTHLIEWSTVTADKLLQGVGRDVTSQREAEIRLQNAEEALRHSQKMEAIGELTGGIAHDFNNMLAAILGAMEMLKRRMRAGRLEDVDMFVDGAIGAANRAAALTHRLLAFARRQPLNTKAVDVNALVQGMRDLLKGTLSERVHLDIHLGNDPWMARTDESQLENAILNLVINARDAMPEGGRIAVKTTNKLIHERETSGQDEIEPGSYIAIEVSDTGSGMAPDVMARVFEPFFTTKPIGQGTGLGLSMIYGFAKQSRGYIRLQSVVGQGTTFELLLPRYVGVPASSTVETVIPTERGEGETVLVVEDDAAVRLIISGVLRELGYTSIEVGDGQAAIPILSSNAPIDLLITDIGLPGLNGQQVAEIARRNRPSIKVLFVTGYAEIATGVTPLLGTNVEMLTKPFSLDALALKIREMLAN